MTSTSISALGIQLFTTTNLQAEQTTLAQLNEQLASGQQYDNLTDYSPLDAQNLMNFQNAITQRQAYVSSMQNVSARLTVYNSTMGDMESIASQASQLATQNPSLDPGQTGVIQQQVLSFMNQAVVDLNQQVGDRYIYAGTRYSTQPVSLNAVLSNLTPSAALVTGNTLPSYDSDSTSPPTFTVDSAPTGSFQVGGSSISWSDLEAGSVTNVTVNGNPQAVTVTGLASPPPALTPDQLASNLASAINQLSTNPAQVSDFTGLTATASGSQVSLSFSGTSAAVTPDAGGSTGETTWTDSTDGTSAETPSSSSAAYTQDTVAIDAGDNLQYGVTSTQTGFQQLIAGMQFINAATQPGVSAATYHSDMSQAATLLNSALTNIQTYNAGIAASTNTVSQEEATQNQDIGGLQQQIGSIQSVDLTQVGTELNLLQTQLQASYSASAVLTQESILKYL